MDTIEIVLLVIDIVEFFIIFFLGKALSNAIKEYNKKAILSISGLAFLTAHPTLFVVLLILAILFFLIILASEFFVNFKIKFNHHKKASDEGTNVPPSDTVTEGGK